MAHTMKPVMEAAREMDARRAAAASDLDFTDIAAAFHAVSNMEIETGTIRDLAIAIIMAASGSDEANPQDRKSALIRLGWLLSEHVGYLEGHRGEVFHLLHPYVHPCKEAQS